MFLSKIPSANADGILYIHGAKDYSCTIINYNILNANMVERMIANGICVTKAINLHFLTMGASFASLLIFGYCENKIQNRYISIIAQRIKTK